MKDSQNYLMKDERNWKRALYESTLNFARRKKGLVLTVAGVLLIIVGSMIPIDYDYWGEPHSFLNNPKALIILLALILLISFLAIYSAFVDSGKIAKRMSIALLVISIIFMMVGMVFVITWTAGIIDRTIDSGPGLYVMFIGVLCFFAGSIISFRENRRLLKEDAEGGSNT